MMKYVLIAIFAVVAFPPLPATAAAGGTHGVRVFTGRDPAHGGPVSCRPRTLNQNNGNSFTSGRREINWDGVPEQFSSPNDMPADFFNVKLAQHGAVFSRHAAVTASASARERRKHDRHRSAFRRLRPELRHRVRCVLGAKAVHGVKQHDVAPCNIITVNFFIPGTSIPATVSGFGVVFTDVD